MSFWSIMLGMLSIEVMLWLLFGDKPRLIGRVRSWWSRKRQFRRGSIPKLPSLKQRVSTLEDRLSELHEHVVQQQEALYSFMKECSTNEQLKHLHGAYRKLQSEAIAMGKELNELKTKQADRFSNLEVD